MNLVEWLRRFNQVRDDLLIEIASTLLLVGFVVGTVDVLTRGGLTTSSYFQTPWAICSSAHHRHLVFQCLGACWQGVLAS